MTLWLIILGMVVVTYSVRLSVIVLLGQADLPDQLRRALRYVPPAALSAIVFPELVMPEGSFDVSFGNLRLIAGISAVLIAYYTRSTLGTIAAGMVILWVLSALV